MKKALESLKGALDNNIKPKVNKYINIYGSRNYRHGHDPKSKSATKRATQFANLQAEIKTQTRTALLALKETYINEDYAQSGRSSSE